MTTAFAEWGAAAAPRTGEQVSGDRCLVLESPNGLLIAGVDGVGHGPDAAEVAEIVLGVLRPYPDLPPTELLRRCHMRLIGTRGAVVLLARYDARTSRLSWAAIGQIAGVLIHADPKRRPRRQLLLSRQGIVGLSIFSASSSELTIEPGDTFVIATDGIHDSFVESAAIRDEPGRMAEEILQQHRSQTDDALVVVVRFKDRRQ